MRLSCWNYRASPSPGLVKVTKSCVSQRVKMVQDHTVWTGHCDTVLSWHDWARSAPQQGAARSWFGSSNSRGCTCLSSFFLEFVITGKRVLSKLIDRYQTGKTKVLQNASINLHLHLFCFEHILDEPEACLFSKQAVGKNSLGIREALCYNFPRIIMSNKWQ